MGYDAIAYRVKRNGNLGDCVSRETMTRAEKNWFTRASNKVQKICGSVDFGLDKGYLECRICGVLMNRWLGTDINDTETPITTERIKHNPICLENLETDWERHSVKMFLEGCQKFGYAVKNVW
ncbi:MAG: hypothetical protein M0P12_00280 [Paludibacteraceae bacterium]|nr:hypothetical protein [Paludibacteraceae bacterium]